MFRWTQSALKSFEKEESCPTKWKAQWVDKSFKTTASEAMDYGNYFEYLCIGANAKGAAVTSIPRTAKGEKTAAEKRIEAQVEVYKGFFDPLSPTYLGYTIDSVQFPVKGTVSGLEIEGTVDILARDKTNKPVIIDLKLTENAFNTFSPYGWGNPIGELDLIQQSLYAMLYEQQFDEKPDVVLLVFEYGVGGRTRVIELDIEDWAFESTASRFETAAHIFGLYEKHGWVTSPSEKECENCPLSCDKRAVKSLITKEKYKY